MRFSIANLLGAIVQSQFRECYLFKPAQPYRKVRPQAELTELNDLKKGVKLAEMRVAVRHSIYLHADFSGLAFISFFRLHLLQFPI